ncbi:hypothetical protein Cni_G14461 [Canna indica]|uniref:Uncharacterized protein n=1 Tax=Canna indica TaxID=4628 RepID=A0AAQ3QES8_9LILI|nr:hypothetical protein Cni_G14461 [Canna indica]
MSFLPCPPARLSCSPRPMATKTSTVSMVDDDSPGQEDSRCSAWPAVLAANSCLLLVGVGGGALLAWWALSFHRSNERLWMVPVGLVLVGTPVVAWLSIFASGLCAAATSPSSSSSDPER